MNNIFHVKIKNSDDAEIITNICVTNNISISAFLNALVGDFLDSTDTQRYDKIIAEAKKTKRGPNAI